MIDQLKQIGVSAVVLLVTAVLLALLVFGVLSFLLSVDPCRVPTLTTPGGEWSYRIAQADGELPSCDDMAPDGERSGGTGPLIVGVIGTALAIAGLQISRSLTEAREASAALAKATYEQTLMDREDLVVERARQERWLRNIRERYAEEVAKRDGDDQPEPKDEGSQ